MLHFMEMYVLKLSPKILGTRRHWKKWGKSSKVITRSYKPVVTYSNKHLKGSLSTMNSERSLFTVANATRSNFGSKHQHVLSKAGGLKTSRRRRQYCTALQGCK